MCKPIYYRHITQTVAQQSVSKKWENWATSAPILPDFLAGWRLFCQSTQVKSFVDWSADFQGFCHQWSVGRWSLYDRPLVGRLFEDFFHRDIGRRSTDHRGVNCRTVSRWHFIKELSADRHRISAVIWLMIAWLSADHKLWFVLYCLQCMYMNWTIRMEFWN